MRRKMWAVIAVVLAMAAVAVGTVAAIADDWNHPNQASPGFTKDGRFMSGPGLLRRDVGHETGNWLPWDDAIRWDAQRVYPPLFQTDPNDPPEYRRFHNGRPTADPPEIVIAGIMV